jgi:ATP-dependent DNA helicase RecQ
LEGDRDLSYNREETISEFKKYYGKDATFKEGQLEAVEAVLEAKRTLVVQKTGWGKSLVYFLATKMIRKNQNKFTLIISPLLVLMNNQIDSAAKLELDVRTINSENQSDWGEIMDEVAYGNVDALIISPERLANEEFKHELSTRLASKIGLFVVDEAHCISDWGHDFRPDYRRIVDLVNLLPQNVPVLATTATANNRVVEDIKSQLGQDIVVSRGPLIREAIAIQTVRLDSREERLVWILNHINEMHGSGIIYCLTVNDCRLVDRWLKKNDISSEAYYSEMETDEKNIVVEKFLKNEIKVLSATVAFGMGFDKPDIGFVIHFQKPGNLVAYYQQIGRAGRKLNEAYAVMMYGNQDDEINEYFIDSAFPTEREMNEIIEVVTNNPGKNKKSITGLTNMKQTSVEKCLKYLEVNVDVYLEKRGYYKTPKTWKPDLEKSRKITEQRYRELDNINQYAVTKLCYMEYIARELDDVTATPCGKCSNCLHKKLFGTEISQTEFDRAKKFIKEDYNIIKPRKQWPDKECYGELKIPSEMQNQQGLVLSNYGDAGWGRMVSRNKYQDNYFCDELVEASAELLEPFIIENEIKCITCVTSVRRPELVKNFAERLANKLGLEFFVGIKKDKDTVCQKELNNSQKQWKNVDESFVACDSRSENTLLVDDMVDSGWTMTVCGYKLLKEGNGKIYPFALANSAGKGQ